MCIRDSGMRELVNAAGGNADSAIKLILANNMEELMKIQVEAIKNIKICLLYTSLSLSEYLRRLGLGKEVKAAITERDYHLFRMLNGLKKELPQLQKEEIISRLEAVLNELK